MAEWMQYLRGLFKKEEQTKASRPFLHESLELNDISQEEWEAWLQENTYAFFKQKVKAAYLDYQVHQKSLDPIIEIWSRPLSKGFGIFHQNNPSIEARDYHYLQYTIYQQLIEKGYVVNVADIRSQQKGASLESIRRIYMKPSRKMQSGPKAYQLYGNIHLEYIEKNDRPYLFKLLANAYQDQNFHPVEDFSKFINLITA